MITYKENDGTPIIFKGSPLHTQMRYGRNPSAFVPLVNNAFESQPNSKFWYDAKQFIIDNKKLFKL